jgi:DNA-binding transcriptional ArsR family regulator
MATNVDLAAIGRLLAAPARAAMLDALFDGQAWSVRELAASARVSPSTACEHLQRLRQAGLVVAAREGRYQLYRLKNDEVADALELLGTLAPPCRRAGSQTRPATRRSRPPARATTTWPAGSAWRLPMLSSSAAT